MMQAMIMLAFKLVPWPFLLFFPVDFLTVVEVSDLVLLSTFVTGEVDGEAEFETDGSDE